MGQALGSELRALGAAVRGRGGRHSIGVAASEGGHPGWLSAAIYISGPRRGILPPPPRWLLILGCYILAE